MENLIRYISGQDLSSDAIYQAKYFSYEALPLELLPSLFQEQGVFFLHFKCQALVSSLSLTCGAFEPQQQSWQNKN